MGTIPHCTVGSCSYRHRLESVEKKGLVPAEHFMGPVLGPFFLPKRVPLMVGPPRYCTVSLPYLTRGRWLK